MPIQRAKPRFSEVKNVTNITADELNIGQIGGRKNVVINGAMQVAQRSTSETGLGASYGYFTVDRFQHNHNGNSAGRYTSSQTASGLDGFPNCLKLDCTTADTSIAAAERFFIAYQMEGQDIQHFKKGTSSAKDFVVSFYAKANGNFTYVCGFYDANNNRTVSRTFSVTSNWQRFTINFGADTTGVFSNNNALSLQLRWYLHAGSNYTGGTLQTVWDAVTNNETAGGMTSSFFSSTDNEFFLTGVQLEVGTKSDGTSVATPFEHRSFAEELALCQRYFFKINGIGTEYATMGAGQMYLANLFLGYFQTPVPMRTRPSFSLGANAFSNTDFSVITSGHVRSISSITPTGDNQYLRINAGITSNGTQGDGGYIQIQGGYAALWNAEL
tara:strand:+ start:345 stop:1499 length:1155 start_codon:yes stop_codon:yes gene_type:complete